MNTRLEDKRTAVAEVLVAPIEQATTVAGNKVLRDTYRLLSVTLIFSAVVAGASAALQLPSPGLLLTLAGYFGFLFLTYRLQNSVWGLASVFALTGFMGYTLGPLLAHSLEWKQPTLAIVDPKAMPVPRARHPRVL